MGKQRWNDDDDFDARKGGRQRQRRGRREQFDEAPEPAFAPRQPEAAPAPRRPAAAPAPTSVSVGCLVKWFDAGKGFGFVSPEDGGEDAFLHASVLVRAGCEPPVEGARVVCDIAPGPKGPQVQTVHSVEAGDPGRLPARAARPAPGAVEGTVVFFNAERGFGFVRVDGGAKEAYVGQRALDRAGISGLAPEQRVMVVLMDGERGPMVRSIATG